MLRQPIPACGLHRPPGLEGGRRTHRFSRPASRDRARLLLGLTALLLALIPLVAILPILFYIGSIGARRQIAPPSTPGDHPRPIQHRRVGQTRDSTPRSAALAAAIGLGKLAGWRALKPRVGRRWVVLAAAWCWARSRSRIIDNKMRHAAVARASGAAPPHVGAGSTAPSSGAAAISPLVALWLRRVQRDDLRRSGARAGSCGWAPEAEGRQRRSVWVACHPAARRTRAPARYWMPLHDRSGEAGQNRPAGRDKDRPWVAQPRRHADGALRALDAEAAGQGPASAASRGAQQLRRRAPDSWQRSNLTSSARRLRRRGTDLVLGEGAWAGRAAAGGGNNASDSGSTCGGACERFRLAWVPALGPAMQAPCCWRAGEAAQQRQLRP